jgi:hypothetical protein
MKLYVNVYKVKGCELDYCGEDRKDEDSNGAWSSVRGGQYLELSPGAPCRKQEMYTSLCQEIRVPQNVIWGRMGKSRQCPRIRKFGARS